MAVRLAGILVDMAGNVARLEKDMKKASGVVATTAAEIKAAALMAKTALEALGVSVGVGLFVSYAKSLVDAQDRLQELAAVAGVATDTFGGLAFSAKQSGVDIETLATASSRFSKTLFSAIDGNKEAKESFVALGLSITDLKNQRLDEALLTTFDALGKLPEGMERTARSQEIMGRGAAQLARWVSEGSGAIREQVEWYKKHSGVTEDSAAAADEFNDSMEKLSIMLSGTLMPAVNSVVDALIEFLDLFVSDETSEAQRGFEVWLIQLGTAFNKMLLPMEKATLKFAEFFGMTARAEQARTTIAQLEAQIAGSEADIEERKGAVGVVQPRRLRPRGEGGGDSDKPDKPKKRSAADLNLGQDTEAAKAYAAAMEDLVKVQREAEVASGELSDSQKTIRAIMLDPAWERMPDAWKELVLQQFQAARSAEEMAEADKEAERAKEALSSATATYFSGLEKEVATLREEVETFGKTREEIERLTVARLEEARVIAASNGASEEALAFYDREIALRKELASLAGDKERLVKTKEFEDERKEEAKKTAEVIEDSLTDALMRGFERGEDIAENFRETLKNMFKTLVLRPLIQAIVQPVATSIGSAVAGTFFSGQAQGAALQGTAAAGGPSFLDELDKLFTNLLSGMERILSGFGEVFSLAVDSIGDLFNKGVEAFGAMGEGISSSLSEMLSSFGGIGEGIGTAVSGLFGGLQSTVGGIGSVFSGAISGMRNLFGGFLTSFRGMLASSGGGGGLGGGGGGGGSLLDMLSGANSLSGMFGGPSIGGTIGGALAGSALAYGAAVPGLSIGGAQAAMLASQTGVFGAAGLAATAEAGAAAGAGAGIGAGVAAALPYIGWATAAAAVLSQVLGGKKGGPASYSGSQYFGSINASNVSAGMVSSSQNSKQAFAWGMPTNWYGIDDEMRRSFAELSKNMAELGKELGIEDAAERLAKQGYSWSGAASGLLPNQGGNQEMVRAALGQISDQMARVLLPNLDKFAQAGESAAQTLIRLVQTVTELEAAEKQREASLEQIVRDLPAALGINELEEFKKSLAVSEFKAPLDQLTAAREQLQEVFVAAKQGDLTAVGSFPEMAQQLLSIGREAFASGPQFAELFKQVNLQLQEILTKQRDVQADILKDVDISIKEASRDQIAVLRAQTTAVVEELRAIRVELRRIQGT